jgi:MFS transporter, DHA1 family, multidrug resistance protein
MVHFSSASVIAANAIARSIAGAGFPMFASYMYDAMHLQWTNTLLGCVAAVMVPIPILFYKFGARIRQKSKLA